MITSAFRARHGLLAPIRRNTYGPIVRATAISVACVAICLRLRIAY